MNSVVDSHGTMLHVTVHSVHRMYFIQFRGHDSVIGKKAHSIVPNRKFRYMMMMMIMMVLLLMMMAAVVVVMMMVNGDIRMNTSQ